MKHDIVTHKKKLLSFRTMVMVASSSAMICQAGCSNKTVLWHDAAHYPHGYIHADQVPFARASALLSPAPSPGSPQDNIDKETMRKVQATASSARRNIAAHDAVLGPPAAPAAFECAMGISFDPEKAPHLTRLLARALPDVETVQKSIKVEGRFRARPYVAMNFQPCVDGSALAKTSSYPSGHAAIGWAWALVLAEMVPDRAETILQRGIDYGNSRVICGFHYPTDVQAGRLLGSAVVSLWHATKPFQEEYEKSKQEINTLRNKSSSPEYCKKDIEILNYERSDISHQ